MLIEKSPFFTRDIVKIAHQQSNWWAINDSIRCWTYIRLHSSYSKPMDVTRAICTRRYIFPFIKGKYLLKKKKIYLVIATATDAATFFLSLLILFHYLLLNIVHVMPLHDLTAKCLFK